MQLRKLEINGGQVIGQSPRRLAVPAAREAYVDAQLDDYGVGSSRGRWPRLRRNYPWRGDVELSLQARFSHGIDELLGTAGFGFWNAPFGDPTVRWPALPQATWFFFASPPTNLPLAQIGPGRGWFASTLDASSATAMALVPLAPAALLFNQISRLRGRIWPVARRALSISYAQLEVDLREWHEYRLHWQLGGCTFSIDGLVMLETAYSPRGPLGFVCWLDNQYLVATNRGRFSWGTLPLPEAQWMDVSDLRVTRRR